MDINLPSIRQPIIEVSEDTRQAVWGAVTVIGMCFFVTATMIGIIYAPAAVVANVAIGTIAVTGITPLEATVITLVWTFGAIFIVWIFKKQIAKLIGKIDVITNIGTSIWNVITSFFGKI